MSKPNNVSAAGVSEADIRAIAIRHKLPMATLSGDYPWSYIENVMAFAHDLLAAASAKPRDACVHDNFSTRVCEYGTRGCIAEHAAPSPAAREAGDRVTLTDAQRGAVTRAAEWCYAMAYQQDEEALRALLREAGSR